MMPITAAVRPVKRRYLVAQALMQDFPAVGVGKSNAALGAEKKNGCRGSVQRAGAVSSKNSIISILFKRIARTIGQMTGYN